MSLPAMLHTSPARKTAAHITNIPQPGSMGLGFHFVALATRTNTIVVAISTKKAHPAVIIGFKFIVYLARLSSPRAPHTSRQNLPAATAFPARPRAPCRHGVSPPPP